jgi:hypothetical protein
MHTFLRKIHFLLICSIALASSPPVQAQDNTAIFYEALSKTQQQKFTAAADSLDVLASKLQGDGVSVYRSRAAADVIRSQRDATAEFRKSGTYDSYSPLYERRYNCSVFNASKNICELRVGFHSLPGKLEGMGGGIITLTNTLERISSKSGDIYYIDGFLDIVDIPKLKKDEFVADDCRIMSGIHKGTPAVALINQVNNQDSLYVENQLAWYADSQTKRIKSIDPKIVECKPYLYGL